MATSPEEISSPPAQAPEKSTGHVPRRRVRIRGEKFCQVCGDKALAHHFGVLACQSCKAFFRRNAFRQSDLKCFNGSHQCEINEKTRRWCPECRLKKCFDAGMRTELILDEDQKKNLMEKVKKKRLQRHQQEPLPSPLFSTLGEEANQFVSSSETTQQAGMDSEINSIDSVRSVSTVEHLGLTEDAFTVCDVDAALRGVSINVIDNVISLNQEYATSSFASDRSESMRHSEKASQLQTELQSACLHGESPTSAKSAASLAGTSVIEEQKKALFGSSMVLTRDQLPSDPQMYRRLTEEERVLLTCLTAAYEDTVLARLQERQRSVILHASNYTVKDYMTECEDQVKHVVSFVQRLADFLSLCLDDRIICFKASIASVLTLRQCYHFVEERNTWLMEKGEMTLDLCKKLFPDIPYVGLSMEVSREVKSIAKNDVNIYALLHCILLFDPGSENISNRQTVCNVRDKYILLLRHYLEATFSFKYSERYARELLSKVVEIPILSEASIREAKDYSCTSGMIGSQLLIELHASD